jgi:hypothetical protein
MVMARLSFTAFLPGTAARNVATARSVTLTIGYTAHPIFLRLAERFYAPVCVVIARHRA